METRDGAQRLRRFAFLCGVGSTVSPFIDSLAFRAAEVVSFSLSTQQGEHHMLLTMESKTAAAHKLEQLITRGQTKAGEVIGHVMNNQPTGRLQRGGNLSFVVYR
jgi:hypothetical protein